MRLLVLILTIFIVAGCKSYQGTGTKSQGSNILSKAENDDEYELTIIDSGFDRWFSVNRRPINYHTLSFYEQQNARYVRAWNQMVDQQGRYNALNYPFENRIDYNPSIDYGLELNYELYHYFRYIEDTYGNRYNFPY
ncbi:hypothetical protein GCM10009122_39490 [Fulvivirga kasyanovii]|uniref:Lipoprotein n=1 Tax=Fulvivirga kasyanovii TaxID=396812 RepID=A0ABW9RSD6_9BACT|nr:DUF6146 family protein [Fulvivirga kasyanovii]MTI25905.1 hypothetical protein [Fulvivirga kasyanovii]